MSGQPNRQQHRNVALELLQKLLNAEIRRQTKSNLVQSRAFSEMLERSIRQYQNRSIETAQVIAELIELAREMREANRRGEYLGLTEEELAFYDALETNDSAVQVMGDETLRTIARELVRLLRQKATVDWTVKASTRAALRAMVKRRQAVAEGREQDRAVPGISGSSVRQLRFHGSPWSCYRAGQAEF